MPGNCYLYKPILGVEDSEYLIIYNSPGETPVPAVAFSRGRTCPEQMYKLSGTMIMTVVLDPNDLEGIHLVNLTALWPNAAFHTATYVSLNPSIPNGDPGGLLADTANDPRPGVYAWTKEPEQHNFERKRVYYPGNVYKVPDPHNKLGPTNRAGKFFYGNLRDLAERFIISRTPREEFGRSPLDPEITRYEQKLQEFMKNILEVGDTSTEALVEGRRMPPPPRRPKLHETTQLLADVQGLVGAYQEPDARQNELGDKILRNEYEPATQQLQELEDLFGPLDSSSDNEVLSLDSQEQGMYLLEEFGEDESSNNIPSDGLGRQGSLSTGDFNRIGQQDNNGNLYHGQVTEALDQRAIIGLEGVREAPQQDDGGNPASENVVDVMAENLANNMEGLRSPREPDRVPWFGDRYEYASTSTKRDWERQRRRIPQMEDSFADPEPLVAGLNDRSQGRASEAAPSDDDQLEVGPGRRRRPSSFSASET
ncbi:hypothetical protein TWF481_004526 [Arthrobotrys musiformis]|uniref:Uncharacterized protein n=1 Tax=Arthrobotrys musiformis TaxID=47236 RepID=A0AAV9WLD2_9PEZI